MATLESILEGDPLVALIDQVILEEHEREPPRHYLGASSIGDECSRKLWYRYNGHKEKFDAKTLRRFADGHRTEEVILGWLRNCESIELYNARNLEDGLPSFQRHTRSEADISVNQIGFSRFNGKFAGHYDAIGRGFPQAPKTWHIVEVKCVNEKAFEELKKLKSQNEKTAIELWNPEYWSQVQVYMHMEGLKRSIHIVATPGARDLISVRTDYNKAHAEAMLAKAKRIIDAKEPLERIGGPTFWKCKQCSFRDICHATSAIPRTGNTSNA